MKKILTLLFIVSFSLTQSMAQWTIGPKVGFGSIIQSGSDINVIPVSDHGLYSLSYEGGTSSKAAGLMVYNNLRPFFLQGEALGTRYKLKYAVGSYQKKSGTVSLYEEEYSVIETSFTAGVNVNNVKIGVGPVVDFTVDKDTQLESLFNYTDKTKKMEHGFHALIGYRFKVFHIDIKYINKFNSISNSFAFGNDVFKDKKSAHRISLSLGVAF